MDSNSKSSVDMGVDVELKDKRATPFSLLLALYNADLALKLSGWEQLDLLQQCEYLQCDKINKKSKRKAIIDELIQDSNFSELRDKSYLRIRIKSVLSQFHDETEKLKSLSNISEWNGHDILISFIYHLISISKEDDNKKTASHPKVWSFADYMRRYFRDSKYNGNTFLSAFDDSKKPKDDSKSNKGFGLRMMKTVCTQFGLKSGPFSKVKKQCNVWATKLYDQSNGIGIQKKQQKYNQNKYVSTVAEIINENNNNNNNNNNNKQESQIEDNTYITHSSSDDVLNGKCWYWFNDYGGLKWIPYRQVDVEKLNTSWRNNEKSAIIKSGSYRVEFDRSNPETPAGHQYNNTIANPNGRVVTCAVPQSSIHGIPVEKQPL